jgi:hypothetical protein
MEMNHPEVNYGILKPEGKEKGAAWKEVFLFG